MTEVVLNPQQKRAVELIDGPALVLAGAGSGKTRVVTHRIVNLISHGISPDAILGVTFTNKAAKEMKERVRSLTHFDVLISTFHSLGARILRESIYALEGYSSSFAIYDDEDSKKLLKACLKELDIKDKKAEVSTYKSLISRAKNALLEPDDIDPNEYTKGAQKFFPKIYALYQKKLHASNALDFDDLLFLTVKLFKTCPQVLAGYQNQWTHFLIDEFQDTNTAQYQMVRLLVAKSCNLMVVGDPDQSIYSWRGANISNIMNFEKDYPSAEVIKLEQNYRSTNIILNAANELISNNPHHYRKKLWSNLGDGEKIRLFNAYDEREEALFVAEKVLEHQERFAFSDMVIFYRTNFQSRALEDAFLQKRIPYTIVGGISFYQRREIKDIIAYLRMVASPADTVSFLRTINLPKRGLGDTTVEKIVKGAQGEPILDYCKRLLDESLIKLTANQKKGLKEYIDLIDFLKNYQDLTQLLKDTIKESRYLEHLSKDPLTFDERKQNLDELVAKAAEWEMQNDSSDLVPFLEELTLKSTLDEADENASRVSLMTIHNGKGLEYPLTFLVGLEENLFPHINSQNSEKSIEEERRLCYVGITRAKQLLYLTTASNRFLWGGWHAMRPSRFLREIPQQYIEKLSDFDTSVEEEGFIEEESQEQGGKALMFATGDTVFHPSFGIGVIESIKEGGSIGSTYEVFFSNDKTTRTLAAKYAPLQKL